MKNILLIITILLFIKISHAQSNVNPNISLIGTFNTFTNNIKNTPEYGKLNFDTPGMELFVDGYLNPYSRASANVAFHEGEFHLEEIYAEILRGLPLDMQIKAGKFLVGFGKVNTLHPHAWPFLEQPLFHQVFFGEEGFNDIGVNVSFIFPTESFYSNFDIGIFKGTSFSANHSHNGIPEENQIDSLTESPLNSPAVVARLSSFFDLSDYTNLEIGVNGSYGVHSKWDIHVPKVDTFGDTNSVAQAKSLKYYWGGIDFKLKYKPDSYTAITFQGEGLINRRNVFLPGEAIDGAGNITSFGGFLLADYLFSKQFSIGAKYDFTYGIVDDEAAFNTLANDDKNKTQGISGWFGYYPVEETLAVRLGIQNLSFNYSDGTKRDDELKVTLQLLFSLGPHKAHPF